MGQVIHLSDYLGSSANNFQTNPLRNSQFESRINFQLNSQPIDSMGWDGLIPVELALGVENEDECLAKIAKLGIGSVHPRPLSDGSGLLIHLVSISDAILINQRILEVDELDDSQERHRIDLIQMLENVSGTISEGIWETDEAGKSGSL